MLSLKVSPSYYSSLQDLFIFYNFQSEKFIYIGNISNPIITRLGVNQYWYRHWYTDKNSVQPLAIHTDNLISKLLNIYLNYGLFFKKNIILNHYWFPFKKSLKTKLLDNRNKKLFRRYHYINASVNFEHAYSIRIQSGEYFPMKTIHLRYKYWYIVCMHWFKPVKKKIDRIWSAQRPKSKRYGTLTISDFNKDLPFNRVKILLFLFLKNINSNDFKYSF